MKKMLLLGVLFFAVKSVVAQGVEWKDKKPVKTNVKSVRYKKGMVSAKVEEVYVQFAMDSSGELKYERTVTIETIKQQTKNAILNSEIIKATAVYETRSKNIERQDTLVFNLNNVEEGFNHFIYKRLNKDKKSEKAVIVFPESELDEKSIRKEINELEDKIKAASSDSIETKKLADLLTSLLGISTLPVSEENPVEPKPNIPPGYQTYTSDQSLKYLYEDYYFKIEGIKKKAWFYFGANFAPQAAGRAVFVRQPDFTANDKMDERAQNERAGFSSMASVVVGLNLGASRHSFYSEFIYRNDRFSSDGSYIDFSSGLPIANAGTTKYSFESKGVGIGYVSAPAIRLKGMVYDLGIAHFWQHYAKTTISGSLNDIVPSPRDRYFTAKFGMGFQYRFRRQMAIRVVPTVYYNLTSASKGALSTNLLNYGVNLGMFFTAKRNKL